MNPSKEEVLEPIQDALYATGIFTPLVCTGLAEFILQYIEDAGYSVTKVKRRNKNENKKES